VNLALLLPAALAALAALLLPLLIHLARRSERRPTDFAALRWLQAQARPKRNLRFDEWPLLALRLVLLALLTLLLARPVLFGAPDAAQWVVAAPGVSAETLRSFDAPDVAERRWLAPGFPQASQAPPSNRVPAASLLRELDASLPAEATLTVLVPEVIDGADAERPELSRHIDWRIESSAPERTVDADNSPPSFPRKRESMDVALPEEKSMDSRLRGNDEPGDTPHLVTPTLFVRHTPDRAPALRYLRAATTAWHTDAGAEDRTTSNPASTAINIADTTQPLPANAKLLIWLAPDPLPDTVRSWVEAGGTALLDAQAKLPEIEHGTARWRDADGDVLVRGIALGRGYALQWTRAMTPVEMPELLEADFPQRLRAVLLPAPPAPARVAAKAYAPRTGAAPWPETPRELAPWLALLIAVLFAIERWFASSPRRRTSG
jgi:hypothetical protein